MALHDPIADLLTRIRNALHARMRFVDFPPSRLKVSILKVLEKNGFIERYLIDEQGRRGRVYLKYAERRQPVLRGLKSLSSPGSRRYVGHRKIPKIYGGMGLVILSTSQGVIDGETARKDRLGGELLCSVW